MKMQVGRKKMTDLGHSEKVDYIGSEEWASR